MRKLPFLVGRIAFGGFFLYNAINHFKNKNHLAQYAASKHVPLPDVSVQLSGVLLGIGATSLMLGLKPKMGAGAIAGFLAIASPIMHNFWAAQDPQARQSDMMQFLKNIALLGATLALADGVREPWPLSVEPEHHRPVLERVRDFARETIAA